MADPTDEVDRLSALPVEIKFNILYHVDPRSLKPMAVLNRSFRELFADPNTLNLIVQHALSVRYREEHELVQQPDIPNSDNELLESHLAHYRTPEASSIHTAVWSPGSNLPNRTVQLLASLHLNNAQLSYFRDRQIIIEVEWLPYASTEWRMRNEAFKRWKTLYNAAIKYGPFYLTLLEDHITSPIQKSSQIIHRALTTAGQYMDPAILRQALLIHWNLRSRVEVEVSDLVLFPGWMLLPRFPLLSAVSGTLTYRDMTIYLDTMIHLTSLIRSGLSLEKWPCKGGPIGCNSAGVSSRSLDEKCWDRFIQMKLSKMPIELPAVFNEDATFALQNFVPQELSSRDSSEGCLYAMYRDTIEWKLEDDIELENMLLAIQGRLLAQGIGIDDTAGSHHEGSMANDQQCPDQDRID